MNLKWDLFLTNSLIKFIKSLISNIFIDAPGWVISDVSFVFTGWGWWGSGLATSDPLAQMTKLALILLQLQSRQLNCISSTLDKWPRKCLYAGVSLLILQLQTRARLLWWLLKLSFKISGPLCSCFPAAMTSLFGYLFNLVCIFLFSFLPRNLQ